MIKFFGAKVLHDVVDRAVQIHGALGYSGDMPLEMLYRFARHARFVDGADEVHRELVARHALRELQRSGGRGAERAHSDAARGGTAQVRRRAGARTGCQCRSAVVASSNMNSGQEESPWAQQAPGDPQRGHGALRPGRVRAHEMGRHRARRRRRAYGALPLLRVQAALPVRDHGRGDRGLPQSFRRRSPRTSRIRYARSRRCWGAASSSPSRRSCATACSSPSRGCSRRPARRSARRRRARRRAPASVTWSSRGRASWPPAMREGAIPDTDPRLLTRAVLGLYNSIWHWYRPHGIVALADVAAYFTQLDADDGRRGSGRGRAGARGGVTAFAPVTAELIGGTAAEPVLIGSECRQLRHRHVSRARTPAPAAPPPTSSAALSSRARGRCGPGRSSASARSPRRTRATRREEFEPYGVGYVELPGEVRVEARLTESDPARLRIGMPMELTLIPAPGQAEAVTFAFRPRGGGDEPTTSRSSASASIRSAATRASPDSRWLRALRAPRSPTPASAGSRSTSPPAAPTPPATPTRRCRCSASPACRSSTSRTAARPAARR